MAYQLILYRRQDPAFGLKEWQRAFRLKYEGHPVKDDARRIPHATVIDTIWIDFETEEEAALFKLTHL